MARARDTYRTRRRKALATAADEARADGLLISRPSDVTYLSGFNGEDSFLLLTRRGVCLITDGRYGQQARAECGDIDVCVRTEPMTKAVARLAAERGVRRLAVQAGEMTLAAGKALTAALGGRKLRPVGEIVLRMRAIKTADEVAGIARAVRVAERAFRRLLAGGAAALAGRRERDIAAELDYLMRRGGADSPAFDTIVAAGPNSALPHYRPGSDKARRGQALLIDWGAWAGGFASDLTRVVFLCRIPPKLAAVYEVVRRAQRAGIAAVRAGAKASAADRAAGAVMESAGLADRILHGLGHGIGRGRGNDEVHELPHLGRESKETLRSGMVVTVEPGLYLPGVGGIRIEDDVLVTGKGPRKLSRLPTSAMAMVVR